MTPAEFRIIVDRCGGPEAFARRMEASPRTVYAYLAGKRKIRPTIAAFIRALSTTQAKEQGNADDQATQ